VLERVGLPTPVGAAIVVLAFVGILVGAGIALAGPTRRWIDDAPRQLTEAQGKLRAVRRSLTRLSHAAQQVQQAASPEGPGGAAPAPPPATPGLASRIFGTTTSFIFGLVEVLLLLYLLLAVGNLFLRKLLHVVARAEKGRVAVVGVR
jgi:predicted PurR-regulated permease PerM